MNNEGCFDLIVQGVLRTYRRWEDIPAVFDHVIQFKPDIPPAPHTAEEHAQVEVWNARLQQLMEKERARSNQNR